MDNVLKSFVLSQAVTASNVDSSVDNFFSGFYIFLVVEWAIFILVIIKMIRDTKKGKFSMSDEEDDS